MPALAYTSDDLLKWLYEHPDEPVAIDTETDGLDVWDKRSKVIGLSIAFKVNGVYVKWYWGTRHTAGKEQNIDKATAEKIRWVLQKQQRPLILANWQFDIVGLQNMGLDLFDNPFYDVLTMQNLINENWTKGRRGLDELAVYTLSPENRKIAEWEWEDEFPLKVEKTTGWPNTTPAMMFNYAAVDALLTYKIWEVQISTPAWKDLEQYTQVWEAKQESIRTLTVMRLRGVLMDLDHAQKWFDYGRSEQARLKEELGLNPKSHKDMKELFINRLGLPVLKASEKTGEPSFAAAVMVEYEPMLERLESPVAKTIREYRGWDTACGLLLGAYLKFTSPVDDRLRTEYTTHVTTTGRLSSRNPNLQQISKESEGKPWKECIKPSFKAAPGYVLISADYSQLELRLATAYTQEPTLKQVFDEGRDIFDEMTEEIREQLSRTNKKLAEGWTRQKTKTLVYSIQYGGGVNRIMSAFGVSKKEAEILRRNFYRTYPRFRALEDKCKEMVDKNQKIKLWTGRYRHFQYKSEGYKAMNSLIQGGAADIVDRVMNHMLATVDNDDCRMLLQVHDALVFEVREELVLEYAQRIKHEMQSVNRIVDPEGTEPMFPVTFAVEVSYWDGSEIEGMKQAA